jgi:CheY-like chemotaxis protein
MRSPRVLPRTVVVVGAWLPFFLFWVLFVMSFAQGTLSAALTSGLVSIGGAAVLGVAVWRFCRNRPWPLRVQPSFYAKHLAAASAYAATWLTGLNGVFALVYGKPFLEMLKASVHSRVIGWQFLMGVWLYGLIAGVSYSIQIRQGASESERRALKAESALVAARLEALRADPASKCRYRCPAIRPRRTRAMSPKPVVVIADDEPPARRALRGHLAAIDWMGEVHEVGDGRSAIRAVDTLRPDVLFLDVVMPGASGLEVVERITHRPYVVFTTAFERYAVTAFEIGALDFLLKPFGRERVLAVVERARSAIELGMPPVVARAREAFAAPGPITRVFVRERGKVLAVPLDGSRAARGVRRLRGAPRRRAAAPDPRASPGPRGPARSGPVRPHPPLARDQPRLPRRDRAPRRVAPDGGHEERRAHRGEPQRRRAPEGRGQPRKRTVVLVRLAQMRD